MSKLVVVDGHNVFNDAGRCLADVNDDRGLSFRDRREVGSRTALHERFRLCSSGVGTPPKGKGRLLRLARSMMSIFGGTDSAEPLPPRGPSPKFLHDTRCFKRTRGESRGERRKQFRHRKNRLDREEDERRHVFVFVAATEFESLRCAGTQFVRGRRGRPRSKPPSRPAWRCSWERCSNTRASSQGGSGPADRPGLAASIAFRP